MSRLVAIVFSLFLSAHVWADTPMKVVFLNPGSSGDAFWGPLLSMMQDAAGDLGIDLETIDASRNHLELRRKGDDVLRRKELPDYLLLVNERDTAVNLIKRANELGVKVFLFNEGLSPTGYDDFGAPREKLTNWIGELIPDDRQSGFLLAKALIEDAHNKRLYDADGTIHLVALNGAHQTNSSEQRLLGLQDALAQYPAVTLHQTIYAYWQEDKAYQATAGLLKRYPSTTIIWSASDLMAQGAMRALEDLGKKPGEDILLGGVDWADLAFDNVRKRTFTATVGGHFLDGAWAMVMLYDYHNGHDFLLRQKSGFSVIDADNIHLFDHLLKTRGDRAQIDFKAFSKTHRTYYAPYDFSLEAVFQHLRK